MPSSVALRLALGLAVVAVTGIGCGADLSAPAEKLVMPKKKKREKPVVEGPKEPDVCTYDFEAKPFPVERRKPREARRLAQDADNLIGAASESAYEEKRAAVIEALDQPLRQALAVDPYSPLATYTMATAYAQLGMKKCAVALLERLAAIRAIPENAEEGTKLVGKAKKDPVFEPFRKDADAVLGDK